MDASQGPGATRSRAGHVALVGAPNVGKSSLLNALIGEKLSIVTAFAQTTREAVTGILTTERAQLIFVDTPGLLDPAYALQASMLESALSALHGADLVALLLDGTRPDQIPPAAIGARLRASGRPLFALINKVDIAAAADVATLAAWSESVLSARARPVSALRGDGLEELIEALAAALPEGPWLYPEDELAAQPVRFFVSELVRESVFELYGQEIPYSVVVRVEAFDESSEPWRVQATVFVERDSQKGIVIGKGGAGIKRLGTEARAKIEEFIGRRIHLELWVKTLPNWRKRPSSLRFLGFPVPRQDTGVGPGRA